MGYSDIRYILEDYFHEQIHSIKEHDYGRLLIQFVRGNVQIIDRRLVDELYYRRNAGKSYGEKSAGEWNKNYYQVPADAFDQMKYEVKMRIIDYGVPVFKEEYPKCAGCGEKHGNESKDSHGFCKKKAEKFWGKVRRLYWHRYTKEKSLV